jgi:hypothetical protein
MVVKVASFHEWNIKKIIDEINQSDIKAVLCFFGKACETVGGLLRRAC